MVSAFKALGVAVLILLMTLSIATIYFKRAADTTRFHPLETGFFAKDEKVAVFEVAYSADPRQESQTLAAFEPAKSLPDSTLIWIDVQFTKERAVVARRVKEFVMPKTDPPGPPLLWAQNLTLEEIKKLIPETQPWRRDGNVSEKSFHRQHGSTTRATRISQSSKPSKKLAATVARSCTAPRTEV